MPVSSWLRCACVGILCLLGGSAPAQTRVLFLGTTTTASVINTCRMSAQTTALDGTLDTSGFFDDQGQPGHGQAQALGELHVTLVCTRGAAVSLIPDRGLHAQGDRTPCGRQLQAASGEQLPYATAMRLIESHGYAPSLDPQERCAPLGNPLTLTARGIQNPAEVTVAVSVLPQDVRPGSFSDRLVLTLTF